MMISVKVGSLLKWEMTDDSGLVAAPSKMVGGLEDFSFSMLDKTDLTFVQSSLIDLYTGVSNTLGCSPFLTIPLIVVVGRLAMFPLYIRLRKKMPMMQVTTQQMTLNVNRYQTRIFSNYSHASKANLYINIGKIRMISLK